MLANNKAYERVSEFLSAEHFIDPVHGRIFTAIQRRCEAGQQWQWDGVSFAILAPTTDDYAHASKSNAISCVLHVTDAAGHSALLAGDIEAPQERGLLARHENIQSTMLLVPHPGSNTSSTAELLDVVRPSLAVMSLGRDNRFGFPRPSVLTSYAGRGIRVLRTDQVGAVTLRIGPGGELDATCARGCR